MWLREKEKIIISSINGCINYLMSSGDLAAKRQTHSRVFQLFTLKIFKIKNAPYPLNSFFQIDTPKILQVEI